MISSLGFALIADGSSDRALIPIIHWTIRRLLPQTSIRERGFVARGGRPLVSTIQDAIDQYAPDILFVHRDAERSTLEDRRLEIPTSPGHIVRVVPVRMMEAWLLIDETALRLAAGNPNSTSRLDLPLTEAIESIPDPKARIEDLLLRASGLHGPRRLKRFRRDIGSAVQRLSQLIDDFSPLLRLSAFITFKDELEGILTGAPRA
ncbi:MAG: hypothetical protein MUE73_08815 [Planctomycetes bacterium]|jgi:hypothetical protein|nr:hypothetical protein [Planctomycetota bacterium]